MGTPRQEDFLIELQESGWLGVGFTCGGYFDQLNSADGGLYYPGFIDRYNMRWAYRIYKEPKRLWKRYFVDYPVGMLAFVTYFLTRSKISNLKK
ncbi:UDP-Gal:alpha-D-GlcNAc-diphosphoundecaprenol beta-1,4-galactosyltransferase [compost metagenome]